MLEGFSPDAVSEVRRRLEEARASGVRILFAVESGSRAWGFSSPDSDYDCRFIYVRPVEDHLKLSAERDVIEFPIEGEIDTSGWDLRKTLLLALKGNVAAAEWVRSPGIYLQAPGFRERLSALLDRIINPHLAARHYHGLLKRQEPVFNGENAVLKKLFYALRPAFCLKYMEERDFQLLPPVNLGHLLENITLPADLSALVSVMIGDRRSAERLDMRKPPEQISAFLAETLDRYGRLVPDLPNTDPAANSEKYAAAERFYIDEVRANDGMAA